MEPPTPNFPIELWAEQLKFLPGNEVYRCKLVCKKWKNLIEIFEHVLPLAPIFPSYINPDDAHPSIIVGSNKLRLSLFPSENSDNILNPGSARANCPIPNYGIYYFEIVILNDIGTYPAAIGIGVGQKSSHLNIMPGWRPESIGYHSDDGRLFVFGDSSEQIHGPNFTTNDIVGCGVDFPRQAFFYTKNGELLDMKFRIESNVKQQKPTVFFELYPIFGLNVHGEVIEVNFGQKPYVFDIDKYIQNNRIKYGDLDDGENFYNIVFMLNPV